MPAIGESWNLNKLNTLKWSGRADLNCRAARIGLAPSQAFFAASASRLPGWAARGRQSRAVCGGDLKLEDGS